MIILLLEECRVLEQGFRQAGVAVFQAGAEAQESFLRPTEAREVSRLQLGALVETVGREVLVE